MHDSTLDLSLVIPVFNEQGNLQPLHAEITAALADEPLRYEIVFVDDGSQDGSAATIKALHAADDRVVLVRFRRNFGQTAAFAAGFAQARGDLIITLDADRQNDPADIPRLVAKLEEGFDVVNGWRENRQDGFFLRKLPSRIANAIIARASGVRLRDRGCSLRAFRREVAQALQLYGEMHRFIPELVSDAGYTMAEVAVGHRPRVAGESKYGLSRTFRVLLDLATVLFLRNYGDRPMHLFGGLGVWSSGVGVLLGLYLVLPKLWAGLVGGLEGFQAYQIGERPLLLLSALLIMIGVQFLVAGLTAELVVRTYYESQNKPVYRIGEVVTAETKRSV